MCGLVGATTYRNVIPVLLDGLSRLEYRGYDSAGLALINDHEHLEIHRCVGRVRDLAGQMNGSSADSLLGIGHTRWATHGKPETRNAHPQVSSGSVAVVHNGIIENHERLKQFLIGKGYEFTSDTDTEVVAHLIHYYLQDVGDLTEAVRIANRDLQGSYAVAVVSDTEPDSLIVTRRDNPLVIGVGDNEHFVASDSLALLPITSRFVFPENGDVIHLNRESLKIVDSDGHPTKRRTRVIHGGHKRPSKGTYRHFMLKEIHEQPSALQRTLENQLSTDVSRILVHSAVHWMDKRAWMDRIAGIQIVACGSSYYAGQVAQYWIESLAGIPCSVEMASEYRYRSPLSAPDCLFIGISQSGETADTLASLRFANKAGYLGTLSICNVAESTMCRESDGTLLTQAGPEIGVASTKAFTTQLLSMLGLAIRMACRNERDDLKWKETSEKLMAAPERVEAVLKTIPGQITDLVETIAQSEHVLVLGRGPLYPVALEGALKLKETSYIHAEGFAAGELKHGPLALVDPKIPVIALAPHNGWTEKVKSNLREVEARGGKLYIFADRDACIREDGSTRVIEMPSTNELLAPITYTVAMQLVAYQVAILKGTDVDKPRNLAKSVTVE